MGTFTQRYGNTINGAITFTGNTVGLSKLNNSNNAGQQGSIGAYISTNTALNYDNYATVGSTPTNNNSGTTLNISENGSFAYLNLPNGSTIEYVDLIWAGSYISGSENNSALIGNPVDVNVDDGTVRQISPEITYINAGNPAYYLNVARITSTDMPELFALSSGSHKITCEKVVGTTNPNDNNGNSCGWTLGVVYQNPTLPSRNITLYSGNDTTFVASNNTVESIVSGFQTPTSGQVNGRILFTALEGDATLTGDSAQISDKNGIFHSLLGLNNPINNFFCSQINDDLGFVNTTGSFGLYNQDAINGENIDGGRQGWDITNVNANPMPFVNLNNNQTSTTVRCTSSGDRYWVTGVGVQLDVNAPLIQAIKIARPATVVVNDTIEYEIRLTNTGSSDAKNVMIMDVIPPLTIYQGGSVSVSVPADVTGFPPIITLNNPVRPGDTVVITFLVRVTGIPQSRTFINSAVVDYTFDGPEGEINGQAVTNQAITSILAPLPPFAPEYNVETCKNGSVAGKIEAISIQRNYPISYFIIVPPSHGFAKINSNTGEWIYEPKYDFVGADSFTVAFMDGVSAAGITTVYIKVLDISCVDYNCLKCRCKL